MREAENTEDQDEERYGAFTSVCIWASAGGASWYGLIQLYRFLRGLLS